MKTVFSLSALMDEISALRGNDEDRLIQPLTAMVTIIGIYF
jgi:hypothetical protein